MPRRRGLTPAAPRDRGTLEGDLGVRLNGRSLDGWRSLMADHIKKRREWELRFPDLDEEWGHWWIDGDGALLAIVGGSDLGAALAIVERHHERRSHIMAYPAKVNSTGAVVRAEQRGRTIEKRDGMFSTIGVATLESRCCLCGRTLVDVPDSAAFIQRPSDSAKETLRCHDECLRPLIHRSGA